MNNVIFLLIDSVFSECLSNNKTKISSTPFIDELRKNAVYAPNVYSYGPYTDAASKALYCGNRTLDDYGYFFGLNSSEYNHFRLFKEKGYEVYGLYYPYYLLGKNIEKHIDHSIYTTGFKYISVWGGKFDYYANAKKTRELTEVEYSLLFKCLDIVFDSWLLFYKNIESQNGAADIISGIYNQDLNGGGYEQLKKEYEKYKTTPKKYVDLVLELGMEHPLAKINEYDYGRKEDADFISQVYQNNKKFFAKISRVNIKRNLLHNPLSLKKSFNSVKRWLSTGDKSELRYFGNYGMLLFHTKLMKERSLKPKWQDLASLNKQIEVLLDNLDKRNVEEKRPFYASLHALEPHHNISFFSFDSFDNKLVAEELAYLEPLISGCGKNFAGNLLYQLSLRYVDFCVKNLYEALDKRGILEKTNIVLVSDHGTSYFFNPVRTHVVNTFHKENYNIPLLIWGKNIDSHSVGEYNGTYCSDDVLPTLCDIVGIEKPNVFTGKSILDYGGREYVITEYMGPGVPDMLNREIWISIRSKNYVIAYKQKISESFNEEKIEFLFDLCKDNKEKKQIKELNDKVKNEETLFLMKKAKERFEQIQKQTKEYVNKVISETNKMEK